MFTKKGFKQSMKEGLPTLVADMSKTLKFFGKIGYAIFCAMIIPFAKADNFLPAKCLTTELDLHTVDPVKFASRYGLEFEADLYHEKSTGMQWVLHAEDRNYEKLYKLNKGIGYLLSKDIEYKLDSARINPQQEQFAECHYSAKNPEKVLSPQVKNFSLLIGEDTLSGFKKHSIFIHLFGFWKDGIDPQYPKQPQKVCFNTEQITRGTDCEFMLVKESTGI